MNSKFNIGDLVKFINIPIGLPVRGPVGVVIDKSDRGIDDTFKRSWAYKVKYTGGIEGWAMEHGLELMAKVKL